MCHTMEKDVLDIQMKLVDISLLKRDIQLLNQKTDLDKLLLLNIQNKFIKVLKDFVRSDF